MQQPLIFLSQAVRQWRFNPLKPLRQGQRVFGYDPAPFFRGLRTRAQRAAAATDGSHYSSEKQRLIVRLDEALDPLKEENLGFHTEFAGNTYAVDYGEDRGGLTLQFSDGEEQLIVNTMKHGTGTYKYNSEEKEWISPDDGHRLTELLMRDIMYVCRGWPELEQLMSPRLVVGVWC